jgi:hypothetical protein
MKINKGYYRLNVGHAVVNAAENAITSGPHHCKETFTSVLNATRPTDGVLRFLRNDSTLKTEELAAHQVKVLHVFEEAMGFKPLARCSIVENNNKMLFYAVSSKWKTSIPLLHILALLTRHYYPQDQPISLDAILEYFRVKKGRFPVSTIPTMKELIANKGQLHEGVVIGTNGYWGIAQYHRRLQAAKRQEEVLRRRTNASAPNVSQPPQTH